MPYEHKIFSLIRLVGATILGCAFILLVWVMSSTSDPSGYKFAGVFGLLVLIIFCTELSIKVRVSETGVCVYAGIIPYKLKISDIDSVSPAEFSWAFGGIPFSSRTASTTRGVGYAYRRFRISYGNHVKAVEIRLRGFGRWLIETDEPEKLIEAIQASLNLYNSVNTGQKTVQ